MRITIPVHSSSLQFGCHLFLLALFFCISQTICAGRAAESRPTFCHFRLLSCFLPSWVFVYPRGWVPVGHSCPVKLALYGFMSKQGSLSIPNQPNISFRSDQILIKTREQQCPGILKGSRGLSPTNPLLPQSWWTLRPPQLTSIRSAAGTCSNFLFAEVLLSAFRKHLFPDFQNGRIRCAKGWRYVYINTHSAPHC